MRRTDGSDGGSAYPKMTVYYEPRDQRFNAVDEEGMSVRQWYIGQAIAGISAYVLGVSFRDGLAPEDAHEIIAQNACAIADAALKESEK